MLTVIIPTCNSEQTLPRTLACLVGPTVRGIVREVIMVDCGSDDGTEEIAEETGARFIGGCGALAASLRAGAHAARSPWLLFLPPETVLEAGWADEAMSFLERCERLGAEGLDQAGVFHFAVDAFGASARRLEALVALRNRLFALPHGEQGLLISRAFYEKLGGHADLQRMEDVELAMRIGRHRLSFFRTNAVTSAARHRKSGTWLRPLRNFACLSLSAVGVPPRMLARHYG